MMIDMIENNIFRIRVPFENFTTSVYIYRCEQGVAIIDTATYSSDVDEYILPALEKLNIPVENVKFILLSHEHHDHVGGLGRLSKVMINARVGAAFDVVDDSLRLEDNMNIIGNLLAVTLPGHTYSSLGFFDTESRTLLSADCLQLDGVDKYRNGVCDVPLYIASMEKLKSMGIARIVAAHDYIPLGSIAEGSEAVEHYLNECIRISQEQYSKKRHKLQKTTFLFYAI